MCSQNKGAAAFSGGCALFGLKLGKVYRMILAFVWNFAILYLTMSYY
ncbi:hypothetical protein HMPREF9436_00940 [Faecalibacterium cf. prausnitzii KLE1255]|uniref:Uncharacterized protein n=1 Tax=Faecalibacterium cf. prausnitzii KLE1255 TaxID=748224 RepID=E2ZH02_9FIRM|nr:hypothetical protein HMPREF9436_00940 [Faecalibacterium cf. prausnitzii KLE1255]